MSVSVGGDEAERTKTIAFSLALSEKPGDRIGHFKLLQQIGEGGFGVVYLAEQEEPVRRRVALKIIKLGMDTKQVIARFEQERQALALMLAAKTMWKKSAPGNSATPFGGVSHTSKTSGAKGT